MIHPHDTTIDAARVHHGRPSSDEHLNVRAYGDTLTIALDIDVIDDEGTPGITDGIEIEDLPSLLALAEAALIAARSLVYTVAPGPQDTATIGRLRALADGLA